MFPTAFFYFYVLILLEQNKFVQAVTPSTATTGCTTPITTKTTTQGPTTGTLVTVCPVYTKAAAGDTGTIDCAAPAYPPPVTGVTNKVWYKIGTAAATSSATPLKLICGTVTTPAPGTGWFVSTTAGPTTDLADDTKTIDITNGISCEAECAPAAAAAPAASCPAAPVGTAATCPTTSTTTTTTTAAATSAAAATAPATTGGAAATTGPAAGGPTTGAPIAPATTGSACSWSSWNIGDCNETCGMCGYYSMSRTCAGPASCQSACTGPATMPSDSKCPPTPCLFPRPNCCPPSVRMSINGRFVCQIPGSGTNGTGPTPGPGPVTPAPCAQTWTAWSAASCNDTCGMCGQLLRNRTCSSSSTCPCSGSAQESVGPCPSNVCQFPRVACCDGYTRQPVNGIYQCQASGKKKRDAKIGWVKSLLNIFTQ